MLEWWEEPSPPPYHLSTHECGTHGMDADPNSSVVDVFGESHQMRGLYVGGGGHFPAQAADNPTQTIRALAYLTADHALGRA